MPLTLALPEAPMPAVPALTTLTRIAEETTLSDGVRVAGELVRGRFLTTALADALHARYFRGETPGDESSPTGRRGAAFCRRLADALAPDLLGRTGWRLAYRTTDGVPSLVVSTGHPAGATASCFLHLQPGTAPEVFARLVTRLDGYGLRFRAELAGDPAACVRTDAAVVTVRRDDVPAVARVVLRLQQRAPFALAPSVPAFTRQLGPGVALADDPGRGTTFGRHRCRLVAAGLVAAGRGAGVAERRDAVLRALTTAGLDLCALHLNPGAPGFSL